MLLHEGPRRLHAVCDVLIIDLCHNSMPQHALVLMHLCMCQGETVASMVFDSVLLLVVLTCALWLVTMVLRWRRGIPVLHNSEWVLSTDLACRSPIPVEFPSTGLTTDADGMCPSHAQHADIGESGPPVPVKKVKMPCEVDIVEDNHDADMECCIVEDIRDDARPDTGLLTGLSRAPLSFKVDSDLL